MTTNNAADAVIELDRITHELEDARADVAMLERLKSAVDREKRLSTEQGKAIATRDRALAAEAQAQELARFAGISSVRVTNDTPDENVLRASFTIEYTKPRWNMYETVATAYSTVGFGTLPPEILDYLIEKRPGLIPADIQALAPDNPREAFGRYFVSKRRGYIVG